MTYIVVYDIANPKRLAKVAKTCLDYGVRVEKSVFECDLDRLQFEDFWLRMRRLMVDGEDALIAYPICRTCAERTRRAGIAADREKQFWDDVCCVA